MISLQALGWQPGPLRLSVLAVIPSSLFFLYLIFNKLCTFHCVPPFTHLITLLSTQHLGLSAPFLSLPITNLEKKNLFQSIPMATVANIPLCYFLRKWLDCTASSAWNSQSAVCESLWHSSEVSHGTGNFWNYSFCWVFRPAFNSSHLICVLCQICRYSTGFWLIKGNSTWPQHLLYR